MPSAGLPDGRQAGRRIVFVVPSWSLHGLHPSKNGAGRRAVWVGQNPKKGTARTAQAQNSQRAGP